MQKTSCHQWRKNKISNVELNQNEEENLDFSDYQEFDSMIKISKNLTRFLVKKFESFGWDIAGGNQA